MPQRSICILAQNYEFTAHNQPSHVPRHPKNFRQGDKQQLRAVFNVQLEASFTACYDKLSENLHRSSYFGGEGEALEKFMLHLLSLITVTIHVKRLCN